MKIYIVKGTHWEVPTVHQLVTLDAGQADVFAAELVALLWNDCMQDNDGHDAARTIEPGEWQERLIDIQALRYGNEHHEPFDKVRTAMAASEPGDRAEEGECDVWIETVEVETPATVRVFSAFYDGEDQGTVAEFFTSERAMEDWLFEQVGASRAEYEAWFGVQKADEDVGINDYLRSRCSSCDNWTWHSAAIPVPGIGQSARVVVVTDGGCVTGVLSDVPVETVVIDYDTEGNDADTVAIPQGNGKTARGYVNAGTAEVDAEFVGTAFALAQTHDVTAALAAAQPGDVITAGESIVGVKGETGGLEQVGSSILHLENVPALSEYRLDLARARQKAQGAIQAMPHLPHSFTAVQDALKETTALIEQLIVALQMEALRGENGQ